MKLPKTAKWPSCLWRFVRRLWARAHDAAPALSEKLIVILSDGRCALADNEHEAQGLVMNECLQSGGMVSANFRPATADEVAALSAPNSKAEPRAQRE